jgi:hypothetical protein
MRTNAEESRTQVTRSSGSELIMSRISTADSQIEGARIPGARRRVKRRLAGWRAGGLGEARVVTRSPPSYARVWTA